jgi:transcriptional regulator with XRE-family HTH domain
MEILDRMFKIMKEKNISQSDLCRYLKVHPSLISAWKQYNRTPSTNHLVGISKCLGVSLEYLITGDDSINYKKLRDYELTERLFKAFKNIPYDGQVEAVEYVEFLEEEYHADEQITMLNVAKSENSKSIQAKEIHNCKKLDWLDDDKDTTSY